MSTELGPTATEQFRRLRAGWKQGEHVIIAGSTGSGKTTLARQLAQIRLDKGGNVLLLSTKLRPDDTLKTDYRGWTRWDSMKKKPNRSENAVILQPKVEGLPGRKALEIQREVFAHCWDVLTVVGKWTVIVDEGLYVCSPTFLNQSADVALAYQQGRSAQETMITLTQRPAHIPLICYSSSEHAFISRVREGQDLKRLAEIGGRESARELKDQIDRGTKHDFLWVPVGMDIPAERMNLRK